MGVVVELRFISSLSQERLEAGGRPCVSQKFSPCLRSVVRTWCRGTPPSSPPPNSCLFSLSGCKTLSSCSNNFRKLILGLCVHVLQGISPPEMAQCKMTCSKQGGFHALQASMSVSFLVCLSYSVHPFI